MNYIQQILINRKIRIFEYFVVFVIIIYAGNASVFVKALESMEHPVGFMFPIIVVLIFGVIKGVRFNHKYLLLLFGYCVYFIASTIKFGALHPRFFIINIIYFTVAYVVVSGLRTRFFRLYEYILYYLCIIGLILWGLMNIMPYTFIAFLRYFEFSNQGPVKGNVDFNTIIYTVGYFDHISKSGVNLGGIHIFRNAGFAWEPGVFASYINLAILFNLIRNRFKINGNKHLWVFMVALASTFSTTGYSLFVLLLFFYLYNQDLVKVIWLAPIFAVVGLLLFTLPFMSEKITDTGQFTIEEMIYNSTKYNFSYTPQRFKSLQIDFVDFLNHPVIGYGGHLEAIWTNQLGAKIATISGFGKIMAQFGMVGILFFLYSLWQSSKQVINIYQIKGVIFPFLFVLLISISYKINTVLYMCFWLLYLSNFEKTEIFRKYILQNILNKNVTQLN